VTATTKTLWLRGAASALLLLACIGILAPALLRTRSFQDENASVQVALNLFTHLHYALLLSRPNFDAFHAEMSIGILSNWPAALGWGIGGNLLWARIAVTVYCLALCVGLGYAFTRAIVPAWRPLALPLSLLSGLLALVLVPGTPQVIVQVLGEFSGAVFLAFGYLLLRSQPRAAAFVLGLCIWHTKFIYCPFALAGILFSALLHEAATTRRLRFLLAQLGLFLLPLVLWLVLVWIRTGEAGLAEWLQRRLHFYQTMHFSDLSRPLHVSGLLSRLESADLEWSHYAPATKAKILGLLFLPCAVLLRETIGRWRSGRRDRSLDVLQLGLCGGLLASAWWYFFLHLFMWLRHLVPALLVGFGVLLYFALTSVAHLDGRRQAWLAGIVCLGLAIESAAGLADTVRLLTATPRPAIFALACGGDDSWRVGPWSHRNCWVAGIEQHRVDLVGGEVTKPGARR
jgi:hypothetical protein